MSSKPKSYRARTRVALLAIVAATVLSFTAAGVGAKPAEFLNSVQQYFGVPTDVPGGIDQSAKIHAADEIATTCAAPTNPDGSPSVPNATCPLTVLPNDGATSGNARAPSTRFAGSRAVYLIKPSELAAVGYSNGQAVTTIGWNYFAAPVTAGSAPLKIYLQNTSDVTYTKGTSFATAITGMTTVHDATTALPGTVGPFDVALAGGSPFTYTGGGIYVAFDWGPYAGTLSTTASVYCNSSGLVGGLAGANLTTDTLAVSSFRPETRMSSSVQNDAGVTVVYSYGELPFNRVPAQAIKAVITNNGATALTNLSVTLNITGADTFTNTQIIPSLASCGAQATVTFAAFTPSRTGNDTITVSVPADDVAANNSISQALNVTPVSYSYKIPGTASTGGVGITGGVGAFTSKFTTTTATKITDVKLDFFAASATTYKVAIYGDSGSGTPSTTPLYLDAADRTVTVAGPATITLPAPVAVGPGNFFVGIHQTNTTNANLGFTPETPVRAGSFFFAQANPVVTWIDFAPGNNFKLNIGIQLLARNARADFDGDSKTDVSVFRPSEGNWYINASTAGFSAVKWGQSGDVVVPGDYDGDGKADYAVWRPSNTAGVADYYVLNSNGFTITGFSHGDTTDIPVAGDFDGDGKADFAVFRPSIGYWFVNNSSTSATSTLQFGITGDVPLAIDNDGDGRANLGVYRNSNNTWYIARSTGAPASNFDAIPFGQDSDQLVPADYDGDGREDVAVFRPSNGTWYIRRSSDLGITYTQFGLNGDIAVPGDYDGDGKSDVAVYRGGVWYINRSTSGFQAVNFGLATDIPVPAKYHP